MAEEFIQNLVENPHPVWRRYYNYWNFLLDSYEGGVDYTHADVPFDSVNMTSTSPIHVKVNGQDLEENKSLYLFKHPKEKDKDYNRRIRRSYYYNFCAPVIDIYTEHLLRHPINEDFGNLEGIVDMRRENMDRRGSSIIEIRKEMAEMSQLYGHMFGLVDMPKANGEKSMADRIKNDKFQYVNLVAPQRVLNWALDKDGLPFWVVIQEDADSIDDPRQFDKAMSNKRNFKYRIWTRNEWILSNSDYEIEDQGNHNIGVVPIFPIYNKKSKKRINFLGISELADVSFIARDIYNLCSELNQIISDQTFSFLAIQGNSQDYGGDESLGTGKGIIYPDGSNVPQYVAPPDGPAQVIMDQIDRQIHKIYQLVKLEGGAAHQEEQIKQQSGIAKAFEFQQTNSALSKKSSNLNDAELKMWNLFARWENKPEFDGSVEYPDDFNVSELNDDIKEALEMAKLSIGQMATIEMNKAILKKKFPRMNEDEFNKIVSEMESSVSQAQNQNDGNGNRLRDRLNIFRQNTANSGGENQNQGGKNG